MMQVVPDTPFVRVTGVAFRSVGAAGPIYLRGSMTAGRWGANGVLYLSASPEGVAAAMIAHTKRNTEPRQIIRLCVDAPRIVDLRAAGVDRDFGIDRRDGACDWQAALRDGNTPRSWDLACRLRRQGACGVIDPSRKAPGLWHLALWSWNVDSAPQVRIRD